jgi:hypothetical protein
LVPDLERGRWKPDPAAVALGIATADYDRDAVALIGATAARRHGAWPRALAAADIATPKQRPRLKTTYGVIRFVKRDVATLDTEAIHTDVTDGWTATREQTILDLARRPDLAGDNATARTMLEELLRRADVEHLFELARGTQGWRPLLAHADHAFDNEGPNSGRVRDDVLATLQAIQVRRFKDATPR